MAPVTAGFGHGMCSVNSVRIGVMNQCFHKTQPRDIMLLRGSFWNLYSCLVGLSYTWLCCHQERSEDVLRP